MDLRTYRVIYDLVDDMRASMEGRLGIVDERTPVGGADVRAVFGTGSKRVAGVMVTAGAVRKGCLGQVRRHTLVTGCVMALRSPTAPCARDAWARCAVTPWLRGVLWHLGHRWRRAQGLPEPGALLTLTTGCVSAPWSLTAPCARAAWARRDSLSHMEPLLMTGGFRLPGMHETLALKGATARRCGAAMRWCTRAISCRCGA